MRISDPQAREPVVRMHTQPLVPARTSVDVPRRGRGSQDTSMPCIPAQTSAPGWAHRCGSKAGIYGDRSYRRSEAAINLVSKERTKVSRCAGDHGGGRAGQECLPPNLRVGRIAKLYKKRGGRCSAAESHVIILWDVCWCYVFICSVVESFPVREGKRPVIQRAL